MGEEIDPRPRTFFETLLFKLDRTIAIVGVVILGCWAISISTPEMIEPIQIVIACVSGLVGYVGGRTGK